MAEFGDSERSQIPPGFPPRQGREGKEEKKTQREREEKNVFEDIIGKIFPNLGKETGIKLQEV